MTDMTLEETMLALDALLETERQALLNGDLDAIAGLVPEKESLIDSLLALQPSSGDDLARLQKKLTRNSALFDSALEGIRSVANRLSTLRRLRRSLETYDQSGRKMPLVEGQSSRLEKRA